MKDESVIPDLDRTRISFGTDIRQSQERLQKITFSSVVVFQWTGGVKKINSHIDQTPVSQTSLATIIA